MGEASRRKWERRAGRADVVHAEIRAKRWLALVAQERKEASILALLAFGCSCGGRAREAPTVEQIAEFARAHAVCAGLGSMVRAA